MKTKIITRKVLSSQGHYIANAETGEVLLSYAPTPIKRFGFSQADISAAPIDILCVGYWLADGRYEPPACVEANTQLSNAVNGSNTQTGTSNGVAL